MKIRERKLGIKSVKRRKREKCKGRSKYDRIQTGIIELETSTESLQIEVFLFYLKDIREFI